MNVFQSIVNRFGLHTSRQVRQAQFSALRRYRNSRAFFQAGATGRLTADIPSGTLSADSILRNELEITRNKVRRMREGVYFKKAISILKSNLLGENGIVLKSMAMQADGTPDKRDRQVIEDRWKDWTKKKNCTVTRDMTFQEVMEAIIPTMATDGELLIRKVRNFSNDHRFALQLLPSDHLDINLNKGLPGGRKIQMGIEYDEWNAPLAYHVRKRNPNDTFAASLVGDKWERIPRRDIVHPYLIEWLDQGRGYPWFAAAMPDMNQLNGYKEAELVGARGAAQNLGVLEYEGDHEYQGEESDDGTAAKLTESEPGQWMQLPKGIQAKPIQWQRPNSNFDMFMKRVLRGLAASLPAASYNIMADDMESVNFSSARIGLMEPRETARLLQRWLTTDIVDPVYEDWLEVQLIGGLMPLPLSKFDKFANVKWCCKRWGYIEPEAEIKAAILRINSGVSSLQIELEAIGIYDFEEYLDRLQAEQEAIKDRKLTLPEILEAAIKQSTQGQGQQTAPAKAA